MTNEQSAQALMTRAKQQRDRARNAESTARKARLASNDALADARKAISSGGTTGDLILDHVLAVYGDIDGTHAAVFRELERRVLAHPGELVSMYCIYPTQEGCTGFGGAGYLRTHSTLSLGLLELNPRGLILGTDLRSQLAGRTSWALPTSRYAVMGLGSEPGPRDIHNGPMTANAHCEITSHFIDVPAGEIAQASLHHGRLLTRSEQKSRLEIYVGDHQALTQLADDDPNGRLLRALDYNPAQPALM